MVGRQSWKLGMPLRRVVGCPTKRTQLLVGLASLFSAASDSSQHLLVSSYLMASVSFSLYILFSASLALTLRGSDC